IFDLLPVCTERWARKQQASKNAGEREKAKRPSECGFPVSTTTCVQVLDMVLRRLHVPAVPMRRSTTGVSPLFKPNRTDSLQRCIFLSPNVRSERLRHRSQPRPEFSGAKKNGLHRYFL